MQPIFLLGRFPCREEYGSSALCCSAEVDPVFGQQIGKYVPIQAGSEVDHALTEISAATDPAQKLALLNKFAAGPGQEGAYPLVADGLYVELLHRAEELRQGI